MVEINEKNGMIFTASGKPFETEKAAELRAGMLKREHIDVTPQPFENGFVLVRTAPTDDDIDQMINDPDRPRHKFWEEPSSLMVRNEDKDPRFEYRVVNDDDNFWRNRVAVLKKAGWQVVSGKVPMNDGALGMPKQIGGVVAQPVGKGVKGILMRKPKKWFEEDMAEKDKVNDEIMRQIKERPAEDLGGATVLPGETTIETQTG